MKQIKSILNSATFRDTLISLVGNFGVALGGFVTTILIARATTPSIFGIYSSLWALSVLLVGLTDLGVSSALINFLPKFNAKRSIYISIAFWVEVIATIGIFLFLAICHLLGIRLIPGSTDPQLILAWILIAIFVFEAFTQFVLTAEKQFYRIAIMQITDSFIKLLIIIFFYYEHSLSIEIALAAAITSGLIATIIGLGKEIISIRFIFPLDHFREIFHFSKWIAITRFFGVTVSRVDVLLLNILAGAYAAGIFSAASRIAVLFSLIVSTLGGVVSPRFSRFENKADLRKYLVKVTLLFIGVAILMSITAIFARPIILLVFGPRYQSSILIFQLLVVAMIPFLLSSITIGPILYFFNKPQFITITTIIQVVLLISLDIFLIPRYTILAPPISLGISNIFVLIVTSSKLINLLK